MKHNYHRMSQWVPTEEDVLDINFRAIVSDLRAIISGTLSPRSWSDIAGTWHDRPEQVRMRAVTARASYMRKQEPQHLRKMTNILMHGGMSRTDARNKARELLGAN